MEAIYADAMSKEESKHHKGIPAERGHVYMLLPSSKITHGHQGGQTPVYPPQYAYDDNPIVYHGLQLQKTELSPRNVILHFQDKDDQDIWLQVSQSSSVRRNCADIFLS